MAYNNSDMAVTLPNSPISPSQVLQQSIQLNERQQERGDALAERQRQFNEREKDRQLANQYKNADLIAEGTDLSKHLTGDTIANDIATQKLAQAMPQFVGMAKAGVSPVDLQMAISKWKNNVVPALDNIKREFQLGDEAAKKMKELYPDLDTESFLTDFRKDIHSRTIDPKTGELVASHLVQPSSFQSQLTNPDFLSKYAKGNKNLVEAIINPKGADDASIPSGSQDSHDVYAAKIPHWKTPNYTQEDVVKGGGFLPKGFVPQLKTKGESLSMDKVPDLEGKGNSVMIADKNDYNRFAENPKTNLELIAATRQMYPSGANRKGYDDFSDVEKEYAKRQVLYNQFENLDRSNFAYKSSLRPSRTNVNIAAAKAKEPTELKDVIGEINDAAKGRGNQNAYPISALSPTAKNIVLDYARNANGKVDVLDKNGKPILSDDGSAKKRELDQSDIALLEQNGKNAIVSAKDGSLITYLDDYSVQSKLAKDAKERKAALKSSKPTPTEDDFNSKWSKLKKGESMVAPDGKTYVKK